MVILKKEIDGRYILLNDNRQIMSATLSQKNCQAIERGYDLDEIKRKVFSGFDGLPDSFTMVAVEITVGVMMELMGDKKFNEDDVKKAMDLYKNTSITQNDIIQSLQQTEWDVEIEMICPHPEDTYVCGIQYGCDGDGCNHPNQIPYLDKDGCLILKRK